MADIGYGSQLQKDVSSTYVAVAQVFDVQGPNLTRDDVEVTEMASADGYREYIPGLKEPGSLTFTVNFLSTNATQQELFHSTAMQTTAGVQGTTNAVAGSFNSDTLESWRVVGSNTDYWDFSGYVNSINQSQPINDRRTWDIGIKLSGAPQFGHGAT